jgi:hypothetical protein
MGSVIPNQEPSERDIEKQKEKAEERRQEYIDNFLSTLEADEFQKAITKQTLTDFYDKVQGFMKQEFDTTLERKDAFEAFKEKHFEELKTLISKADTEKLDEFLDGKFKEKEAKKKKRRKKKRKNKEDN